MDADLMKEIKKLIGERDIRNELCRYQEAINRADLKALEAFFGDAKVATVSSTNADEFHGVINGGKQFADGFEKSVQLYNGSPRVQYSASNILITFNDTVDTATCHCYWFIFQGIGDHDYTNSGKKPEFPLQVIGAGRFLDTYKLRNGAWKIAEREIYSDFSGDYSRHMRLSPLVMAEKTGSLEQKAGTRLRSTVQDTNVSAMRAPD